MDKTKVICLIGASGSGKTTVALKLDEISSEYNIIQSYTTRPPREKEEWGHTFIDDPFISYDKNNGINYIQEGLNPSNESYWRKNMIAYFNSYKSGHHYFATDDQVIRGKTNIYIVDSTGAEMVHEFYKDSDVEVITVYLQVDERIRKFRMDERFANNIVIKHGGILNSDGTVQIDHINKDDSIVNSIADELTHFILKGNPDITSRLESDKLLFQTVKCDYVIDGNQDIDMVVNSIRDVI